MRDDVANQLLLQALHVLLLVGLQKLLLTI
jgi:hypothetical protein